VAVVRIDWNPEPRPRRSFGLGMTGSGLVMAGILWWLLDGHTLPMAVAGVFGIGGLLVAALPDPAGTWLYRIFLGPAWLIGNVVSRILVTIVFYLLITPLGLLLRAVRPDSFGLGPPRESYWSKLREDEPTVERYERPF
jgi:hypothetical protein